MPKKDVTAAADEAESLLKVSATLTEDIIGRWPIWVELAKRNPGKMSSPYMAVATQLLAQGMVAMLCAQVAPPDVMDTVESFFDLYTNPEYLPKFVGLSDDKADIMAFLGKILEDNRKHLANSKKAN